MRIIQHIRLRLFIASLFAVGITLVLLPLLAGLLIVSFYAALMYTSTYAKNIKQQSQVKEIIRAANAFNDKYHRYPTTLDELRKSYILPTPEDHGKNAYPYSYKVTEEGKNCIVAGIQHDGKLFSEACNAH
jgi:Na+-translocating ferredoxin:NAD+ oxidoreductase RnfG subunit